MTIDRGSPPPQAQTGAGVQATQRKRGSRGGRRAAAAERRRAAAELAEIGGAIEREYRERRDGWEQTDRPALSIPAQIDGAAKFDKKIVALYVDKTNAQAVLR